jgi:hypothetical protein
MAQDQQLKIRLDVIDGASKALKGIKDSVFSLKGALIALGAGVAVKALVNIGKSAEETRVRLNLLTGDVTKGGLAFNQFTQFAVDSKVPLDEVIASAKKLLGLGSSPQRLAKNLEIIKNISAQTGLSFQQTVDQFGKATTKGLDSARLFADENIRVLMGIPKGLEVSGREALSLFEKDFSGSGRFGQANKSIKDTLTGTIIGLQNLLFVFSSQISKGFFGELKKQLGDLEKFFNTNKEVIINFANSVGTTLANAIVFASKAFKIAFDNANLLISLFVSAKVFQATRAIQSMAVAMGLLNSSILANPIALVLAGIAGVIVLIATNWDKLSKSISDYTAKVKEARKETSGWSVDMSGEVGEGLANVLGTDQVIKDLEKTQEAIKIIKEEISKPINDSFLEKILDKFKDLTEITKTTTTVIAEEMVKAIDGVSQGIAESIVLGKNLKTSLKEVAQTILVDMIKAQLKEIGVLLAKLALEKSILFYKQAQASVSGGSGIFSSILGAFGGGGGTTAIDTSVISPFAEGGSVKGGEPITVGERGREVFMPKTDGTIIPSEKIGGVNNINFTIQSADVRGIKELLIDNRATITNIVNQALNARGRPALI